jgi:hypothetical protein
MAAAPSKTLFEYARHRPELTPCYQVVQNQLNTFISDRQAEGRPLPDYVIEEFDEFLKCRILAHGFLRLQCNQCHKDMVVAYSCKRRGFCPSCAGRRSAETAAHLVDSILPKVPYRQFVISFPIPMRYWINTNKKIFAKIRSIINQEIASYYAKKSNVDKKHRPTPGTICFTQRWGSALNLNPHLHILLTDGVYHDKGNPSFRKVSPITEKELENILKRIVKRTITSFKKHGYLSEDGEVTDHPLADPLFQDHESLDLATRASLEGRIAFGPNAGKKVTKIGGGFGYYEEIPLARGKRCLSMNGFSIHANRAINTQDRTGLEQLISYISRGPLSNDRLTILPSGNVRLRLKSSYRDGTSHLVFTMPEILEKLTALIPPPKTHLVVWSGCFAANSPYRRKVVLKPDAKKGFDFKDHEDPPKSSRGKNYSWSKLLARVFKIDVETCTCGGKIVPVANVMKKEQVERYLIHIEEDTTPPARGPPRGQQMELFAPFVEYQENDETEPVIYLD